MKNTTIRLQDLESIFYFFMIMLILSTCILICYAASSITYICVYKVQLYLSNPNSTLVQLYKMDAIYLHCTFILCRHWKDVNIGDYLIKRESLLGLLDGGHHVLLPL